jgi:hypothetical protein
MKIMGSIGIRVGLLLCGSILMATGLLASQNITNDGTVWSVSYDGDYLPNNPSSDPAWTTFAGSGFVSGGVLTFTSLSSFAEMNNTAYWNGGSGGTYDNTVAFRMRTSSTAPPDWRGRTVMNNGQNQWVFIFTDTFLYLGNSYIYQDMTAFHTYRIVQSGSLADLYVDGVRVLTNVPPNGPTTANTIYFGQDLGTGNTQWDWYRWTNEGAFVPEPSISALLGLGGLLILRRRR